MKTYGEVWESKLQERMMFIQEFMRAHGPWPSGTMLSYVGEATFGDTCFWSSCRWHVAPAGDWFELLVHEYFCGLRRGTNNCDAVFGSCKYVSLNAVRWIGIREKVIHGWLATICVRINQGNFQVNRDINHFTQIPGNNNVRKLECSISEETESNRTCGGSRQNPSTTTRTSPDDVYDVHAKTHHESGLGPEETGSDSDSASETGMEMDGTIKE